MPKYKIAYPGISFELVFGKDHTSKNFYEIVSSCGVFCRMPKYLQVYYLNKIKESIGLFSNIVFITDRDNRANIQSALNETFPEAKIFDFYIKSYLNEFGLRVNCSTFNDESSFKKYLVENPQTLVIISTPYSCPKLHHLIENKDSLANRSVLLYFENKSIYTNVFKNEMGYIEKIEKDNPEKLRIIKDDELYFIKAVGEYTGGNYVFTINRNIIESNFDRLSKIISKDNFYLYKNLNGANVISKSGVHFGTQIRPFVDNYGNLKSFIIKYSGASKSDNNAITSIKRLNQIYNSSSGNSNSILFEINNKIEPTVISLTKKTLIVDKNQIENILDGLKLFDLNLNAQKDLIKILEGIYPKSIQMLNYFDNFFFSQNWDDLYKRFISEKTYFYGYDSKNLMHLA